MGLARRSTRFITSPKRSGWHYADRNTYLGDPDFVRNPVAQLLAPEYAATLRAKINPDRATPSVAVRPGLNVTPSEGRDTTHYSIVDRWGNAVSVTYTLNDWFGAGVIAGETGFFLNDEMDDFTCEARRRRTCTASCRAKPTTIEPGKTSALVDGARRSLRENGKLAMVTGSPGGSRIITIVARDDARRARLRNERAARGRRAAHAHAVAARRARIRARRVLASYVAAAHGNGLFVEVRSAMGFGASDRRRSENRTARRRQRSPHTRRLGTRATACGEG